MRLRSALMLTCVAFGGAACAPSTPMLIAPDAPPSVAARAPARAKAPAVAACRVHIDGVADVRADKENMGEAGFRSVRMDDFAAWVLGALAALDDGDRVGLVDDPARADVSIKVELVKAYIYDPTGSAKAAQVVLRVSYAGPRAPAGGPQIYRGGLGQILWANDDGETKGALDSALVRAVKALRGDILAACKGA